AGGVPSGARPDAATAQVLLLAPPTWHAGLRSTLALVGIDVLALPAHPTTVDLDLAIPRCTVAVLVGELDWAIAGRLQRAHMPHLLLTPGERSVNASSWVVPGQQPCLRCQYLCQRDADPLWREVLAQLHNWPTPDPDPLLVHGCGLYVANVLRTHLSASASSTPPVASGQVRLAVTGAITNTRNSTFHPACGCARGVANEKTRVAA
ncbi:MAG: hypothetical protein K0U64_12505, partial [Actinomycetia bacterium]|nr:hypothetical protein [Actinomycetes bacterium]